MTTPECDIYVDTCFLMKPEGRNYLREKVADKSGCGQVVQVLRAVRDEVLHLADSQGRADARSAYDFLRLENDLFCVHDNWSCYELDARRFCAHPGAERLEADDVLRLVALHYRDCGKPVRFLTADMALAETLSNCGGRVTFLARYSDNKVVDWSEFRASQVQQACWELAAVLGKNDLVLTASGLRSPYLEQFLLNLRACPESLPGRVLLHQCSLESLKNRGFLTLAVMSLLRETPLIQNVGNPQIGFCTEGSMLESLYFARSLGRDVIFVCGDDEWGNRYDARTRGHLKVPADVVSMRVITPVGALNPQIHDWYALREAAEKLHPVAVAATALAPEIPAPPTPVAGEEPESEADRLSRLGRCVGAKLGTLVRTSPEEVLNYVQGDSDLLCLAVLYARRWNCPGVVHRLLAGCHELPVYCLNHWFRRSKANKQSMSAEELLSSQFYFESLLRVMKLTPEPKRADKLICTLKQLSASADHVVKQRACLLLMRLGVKAYEAAAAAECEETSASEDGGDEYTLCMNQFGNKLVPLLKSAAGDELLRFVAENPTARGAAVLLARRWKSPAVLRHLLDDAGTLPLWCFNNWFRNSASIKDPMSEEELLADDEYYGLLVSVVKHTPDAAQAERALATLRENTHSADVRAARRSMEVLALLGCGLPMHPQQDYAALQKSIGPALGKLVKNGEVEQLVDRVKKSPSWLVPMLLSARQHGRVAVLSALLSESPRLPAYCLEHWFERRRTGGPTVVQLLSEREYIILLRRIVALSVNLASAEAAIRTLKAHEAKPGCAAMVREVLDIIRDFPEG